MMRRTILGILSAAAAVTAVTGVCLAAAEPVSERLLSGMKVAEHNACTVIKIEFSSRAQYVRHTPDGNGDELRIVLNPIDPALAKRSFVVNQESLCAPQNERASIHAVELEFDANGAALMVYFKRKVAFSVAGSADFKSVTIAVSGVEPSDACRPVLIDSAAPAGSAGVDATASAELDQLMKDARSGLSNGAVDQAFDALKKVTSAGAPRYAQEAKELTGVAIEKKGDRVRARAEYQSYLTLYPAGPGTDRVRARLAAMDQVEFVAQIV